MKKKMKMKKMSKGERCLSPPLTFHTTGEDIFGVFCVYVHMCLAEIIKRSLAVSLLCSVK